MTTVSVIGAGLAGSEAAWQLAERGTKVKLYEMRPEKSTPAHKSANFAELVCSNSFKSLDVASAAGTLKAELAILESFVLECAMQCRVSAGKALAVDREAFSSLVTQRLREHPNVEIISKEIEEIPEEHCIIATGPLTSDVFANNIARTLGENYLSFYDAAAPIVSFESLNMDRLFLQSRYSEDGDYLNAPLTKSEYEGFVRALLAAKRATVKDFEKHELFSACQPVEEIAKSGEDALRFGALKPVGLIDPETNERPYAVVQLRAENAAKTIYNLVGFQTNLMFAEQERVFRMIPGLENADFQRFGVMHRNTFLNSPKVLNCTLSAKAMRDRSSILRFAGQITGTEGYTEAIASGICAALFTYADLSDTKIKLLPKDSTFGALLRYASCSETKKYQPMHVNFGLLEPLGKKMKKSERYKAYSERAIKVMEEYKGSLRRAGIY